MKLLLSPVPEKCSVSYIELMKSFKSFPDKLESLLMDDLVYNQIFVCNFFKVLNVIYPNDFVVQINSFVQEYTLKKLLESGIPLEVVCIDSDVEKYYSGDCYLGLYKRLKKEKLPVSLSNEHSSLEYMSGVELDEITYILLQLEREVEKNMGLSDLIKAASDDLRSKSTVSKSDGELTRAMRGMGLDLDTGESFMNPPQQSETKQTPEKPKKAKKIQKKVDKPQTAIQTEDVDETEENDICYKVVGNKIAILIPEDTPMDTVELNGMRFRRILTELPDLKTSELQVKRVLNDVEDEQKIQKPQIVRVPIFLSKTEIDEDSAEPADESEQLSELRLKKQELDSAIADARKSGDTDLVNELRKQRRKVRNMINKLSEG